MSRSQPKRSLSSPEGNCEESKMVKLSLEDLDRKFDTRFDQLTSTLSSFNKELQSNINDLKLELGTKINSLEQSVATLEVRVDSIEKSQEDPLDSFNKLSEVKITGIPYKKNENLQATFGSICSILGFTANDLKDVNLFRLPGKIPNNQPIVVKFNSVIYKDRFIHAYYKVAKTLTLNKLTGIDNGNLDSRIYIQSNLTKSNYLVNRCALDLKKKKKILKSKIKNGNIFVQIKAQDDFVHFKTVEELKTAAGEEE